MLHRLPSVAVTDDYWYCYDSHLQWETFSKSDSYDHGSGIIDNDFSRHVILLRYRVVRISRSGIRKFIQSKGNVLDLIILLSFGGTLFCLAFIIDNGV